MLSSVNIQLVAKAEMALILFTALWEVIVWRDFYCLNLAVLSEEIWTKRQPVTACQLMLGIMANYVTKTRWLHCFREQKQRTPWTRRCLCTEVFTASSRQCGSCLTAATLRHCQYTRAPAQCCPSHLCSYNQNMSFKTVFILITLYLCTTFTLPCC